MANEIECMLLSLGLDPEYFNLSDFNCDIELSDEQNNYESCSDDETFETLSNFWKLFPNRNYRKKYCKRISLNALYVAECLEITHNNKLSANLLSKIENKLHLMQLTEFKNVCKLNTNINENIFKYLQYADCIQFDDALTGNSEYDDFNSRCLDMYLLGYHSIDSYDNLQLRLIKTWKTSHLKEEKTEFHGIPTQFGDAPGPYFTKTKLSYFEDRMIDPLRMIHKGSIYKQLQHEIMKIKTNVGSKLGKIHRDWETSSNEYKSINVSVDKIDLNCFPTSYVAEQTEYSTNPSAWRLREGQFVDGFDDGAMVKSWETVYDEAFIQRRIRISNFCLSMCADKSIDINIMTLVISHIV